MRIQCLSFQDSKTHTKVFWPSAAWCEPLRFLWQEKICQWNTALHRDQRKNGTEIKTRIEVNRVQHTEQKHGHTIWHIQVTLWREVNMAWPEIQIWAKMGKTDWTSIHHNADFGRLGHSIKCLKTLQYTFQYTLFLVARLNAANSREDNPSLINNKYTYIEK